MRDIHRPNFVILALFFFELSKKFHVYDEFAKFTSVTLKVQATHIQFKACFPSSVGKQKFVIPGHLFKLSWNVIFVFNIEFTNFPLQVAT